MIYKYKLDLIGHQVITMPVGARVLHVDCQRGDLCVWVLVNPDPRMGKEDRTFRIFGTGHVITGITGLTYLGTVIIEPYVWHVFEPSKGNTLEDRIDSLEGQVYA